MRSAFLLALVPALTIGCGSNTEKPPDTGTDKPGTYQGRTTKEWLERFQLPDRQDRAEAGEALGTIADDEAADGLIAALNSANFDKSIDAARYLGWMKGKASKVLPALEARTKHHMYLNDANYQEAVDTAIRKLKGG